MELHRSKDLCICGIGSIAADCCGRIGKEATKLRGKPAARRALNLLRGFRRGQILAERVVSFYGDEFVLIESTIRKHSSFNFAGRHDKKANGPRDVRPQFLSAAIIALQLNSDRVECGLMHELLHLDMAMNGYPVFCGFEAETAEYAERVSNIHSKTKNLLDHEVFATSFIELGFDRNRFLALDNQTREYENTSGPSLEMSREEVTLGFAWWGLEYLRHWITGRHIGDPALDAVASRIETCGARWIRDFSQRCASMRQAVESRLLLTPRTFVDGANQIYRAMSVPEVDRGAVLSRTAAGLAILEPAAAVG